MVCRGVFKGSRGFRDLNEGKPVFHANDSDRTYSSVGEGRHVETDRLSSRTYRSPEEGNCKGLGVGVHETHTRQAERSCDGPRRAPRGLHCVDEAEKEPSAVQVIWTCPRKAAHICGIAGGGNSSHQSCARGSKGGQPGFHARHHAGHGSGIRQVQNGKW